MMLLARSLRHRLGDGVTVRQVQYRLRGWNGAQFDALRDAEVALDDMREEFDAARIVVVGHSMGGRVAAHLAANGDVGAVVALAPWWPRNDADLVPASCRLLVLHGTADTRTDPGSSRAQTRHARDRGVDAQWVAMAGAGPLHDPRLAALASADGRIRRRATGGEAARAVTAVVGWEMSPISKRLR